MKKAILIAIGAALLTSCAHNKDLIINNKVVTVEPYGWADYGSAKNDSVIYNVSVGNVVWSIIGSETIIIPVWLTGYDLFEPVKTR